MTIPPGFLDRPDTQGSVAPSAGENDPDGLSFLILGKGAEKHVDRQPKSPLKSVILEYNPSVKHGNELPG